MSTATIFACTACIVTYAVAEPLDYQAARERAFEQARITNLSENAAAANRARLDAAAALPNPSVFVDHEFLRGGGLGDHDETTAGISTRLDFLWKRGARIESAEREGRIGELRVEGKRHRLAHEMAQLYLGHGHADAELEVLWSSLDSLRTARQGLVSRVERGDSPSSNLRRLDLAIQQLEMDAVDIETRQAGLVARIAALVGVSEVTPVGSLPLDKPQFSTVSAAVAAAHSRRPDFLALEAYGQWRAAEVARKRAEGRPEASLDVAYKSNSENQSGAFIGLSLEIPIFGGSRSQTRLARTEYFDVEMEVMQAHRDLAGEVAAAFHRWQRLSAMTQMTEQAASNEAYLRAGTAAFQEGESSLLEYVDTVHAYLEGARGQLTFINQLNLATLELVYLTASTSIFSFNK